MPVSPVIRDWLFDTALRFHFHRDLVLPYFFCSQLTIYDMPLKRFQIIPVAPF
jgi:hypothetical protein